MRYQLKQVTGIRIAWRDGRAGAAPLHHRGVTGEVQAPFGFVGVMAAEARFAKDRREIVLIVGFSFLLRLQGKHYERNQATHCRQAAHSLTQRRKDAKDEEGFR